EAVVVLRTATSTSHPALRMPSLSVVGARRSAAPVGMVPPGRGGGAMLAAAAMGGRGVATAGCLSTGVVPRQRPSWLRAGVAAARGRPWLAGREAGPTGKRRRAGRQTSLAAAARRQGAVCRQHRLARHCRVALLATPVTRAVAVEEAAGTGVVALEPTQTSV